MTEEQKEGMILIDKPIGWTSFDVVKKLRRISGIKKIGHAGTLDPLASGLLIICYGRYTRKIEEIQVLPKVYTGSFTLGKTTPSFDLETEIDAEYPTDHIDKKLLEDKANEFLGDVQQIPPVYSAIKIKGKRAYEFARSGREVELKSREITIRRFEIKTFTLPEIEFEIECSKGTYIRSIARDYGLALGSGAYLSSLRRTAIGPYKVDNALDPSGMIDDKDFYLHSIKTL